MNLAITTLVFYFKTVDSIRERKLGGPTMNVNMQPVNLLFTCTLIFSPQVVINRFCNYY